MDLAAVMDEVKAKLVAALPTLNVFAYPPGSVTPPAAVITYPDRIDLGVTYQGGMSRIESLPVVVVVGKVSDPDARDTIAAYVKGSGASSVPAILEAGPFVAFSTLNVVDVEFSTYQEASTTYLAATFHLDITGPGG
jgi:hypothetical protein